jgi:hypothetical protein
MRARFLSALAGVLVLAGVASAQAPAPALVIQVKPVSRLLVEFKEMIKQVGGPARGETMVKEFEAELKEKFGEKGFEGLDINRPIAVYSIIKKDDPEDSGFVLVAPVTGEKEFIEFLKRIELTAEPVKDKKGVYQLEGPFPKGAHVRVTDAGWAYISLNDGGAPEPKDLVAVGDLFDNADPSLASIKVFPGRIPEKFATAVLTQFDNAVNAFGAFAGGAGGAEAKFLKSFLENGPKLLRRYIETAMKEVTEVAVRFNFDPTTGDTVTELTIVPKAGTPLSKEFAARKPTTNRFAGLMTKDAAGAVLVKAPLFAPEVRDMVAAMIEAVDAATSQDGLPEKLRPVASEVWKGLARTVKTGDADAAIVLHGPNKAGKFTLVVGLSFDDPSALEKAVRAAAKDSEFAKEFELDAAKVGDVSIHKVPLYRSFGKQAGEDLPKVFGDKVPTTVAFAKDAIFFAMGPDSFEAVKTAAAAKPGPAPVLDVVGNMARFQKLFAAMDPMGGMMFAKHIGTDDKQLTALRLTVEGGDKLTAKLTVSVRVLPKFFILGESVEETFEKVGEAPKP